MYTSKELDKIRRETAEGMEKRYNRLCKRYKKKGIQEYTFKQFAEKIRKEEKSNIVVEIIAAVLYAAVVINGIITGVMQDGLRGGIISGIVYLSIMGMAYYFYYRLNKVLSGQRLTVIDECELQGISISEYIDRGYEEGTFL